MNWYFAFFFFSGFCGILYELVWLRLAMAQFGVTTALVSIVLSVFMAGLGLGSLLSSKLIQGYANGNTVPPLRLYALCELLIGFSALLVPVQFLAGHRLLQYITGQSGISSGAYYLIAGAWLAFTLIPWCACMGATIPLAMSAISRDHRADSRRSFSFLYVANLVGALVGAILPLLFIEAFGFHRTLGIGAALNFAVALGAAILSFASAPPTAALKPTHAKETVATESPRKWLLPMLFLTGLTTMGMEVVWIRLFTPSVGPFVYSFALILASYLFATFAGSRIYRSWSRKHSIEDPILWVLVTLLGVLPLLTSDIRLSISGTFRVFLGVMPVSFVIGFLTPMLIDRWSQGDPGRGGRAYALNVLGCILGPLIAGFLLLPLVGERYALLLFLSPFFAITAFPLGATKLHTADRAAAYAVAVAALFIVFVTRNFEVALANRVILRDSTATVIAADSTEPGQKLLLVNGIIMTSLNPITKMMAHLTLASHLQPPQNTLVICFGMGTTFRSALTWGAPVTVVDLIPSVPRLFPNFHHDAAEVLSSSDAHVIVDDGRRFLERTPQTFDSIIVDPPPPVPAAGSSLLYSVEFYSVVKQHLRPYGIFQQWLPEGDQATKSAVARSLQRSFPYVRTFNYAGTTGWHFLASLQPIPTRTSSELAAQMPARARTDFVEWGPYRDPEQEFQLAIAHEVSLESLIALAPGVPPLQDDRPINEYYFLRTPCPSCNPAIEFIRRGLYVQFVKFFPSFAKTNTLAAKSSN